MLNGLIELHPQQLISDIFYVCSVLFSLFIKTLLCFVNIAKATLFLLNLHASAYTLNLAHSFRALFWARSKGVRVHCTINEINSISFYAHCSYANVFCKESVPSVHNFILCISRVSYCVYSMQVKSKQALWIIIIKNLTNG